MRLEELEAYLQEYERRWRERTPATEPQHVDAAARVTFKEMCEWWCSKFGEFRHSRDEFDVMAAHTIVLRKMRERYPLERWST